MSVVTCAILGLSLNEAAYLSEVVRGAVKAVPEGQRNAALALGMTRSQVFRDIVLPQAMRVMIPTLGNGVNGLLKTTSHILRDLGALRGSTSVRPPRLRPPCPVAGTGRLSPDRSRASAW